MIIKSLCTAQQLCKTPTRNLTYAKLRTWYANLVPPKPSSAPYNHVTQIGDPVLREKAEAVPLKEIKSNEVQFLAKLLIKVLKTYDCVGLSASQIGIPYRMFAMEFGEKHGGNYTKEEFENKEMTFVPLTVVINPEIKITDYEKISYPESCESVKGFYADVPRHKGLALTGFDPNGDPIKIEAKGWTARIIQHEMDHLNGVLYTDIMDKKSLCCSCWEAVNQRRGRVSLPFSPHL